MYFINQSQKFKGKKAEMGIGTLIIFIAMILVAAIAAGVLLQTASSLQNKALLTGEKSKEQVSTGLITLQIFAEDGISGNVGIFCQTIKLQPGSDPLKFRDTLINFDTDNVSSDKNYGNETRSDITSDAEVDSGIDFDHDGVTDHMILNSSGEGLIIEITNGSNPKENVTIPLVDENGNTVALNETNFNNGLRQNITVIDADVNDSATSRWGAISIIGWNLDENLTLNHSKVYIIGAGNGAKSGYSVTYLVEGSSFVNGYLNRGDVARVCYSAPRLVNEDEDIALTFVPKTGTTSIITTAMPNIMSQKRIYVYPWGDINVNEK